MRGIHIVGIIVALAVAVAESLKCMQCHSWEKSCDNITSTECIPDSNSCLSSLVNSSLGGDIRLYQKMSCSAENCTEETNTTAFTVHVSDDGRFHFASQCCQGKECGNASNSLDAPLKNTVSNTECPACHGPNETTCSETTRKCYKDERCVYLLAQFENDTMSKNLVLKGCSDISNSICQFLNGGNKTLGGVIFQKFECANPKFSSTTNHKASLFSLAFASLLLLGLLL
ncbi:ly6/PLAUR domain-containing protein 8 [Carlito syrichta]|uniref:Ly6/PLAUR domain-containing protein 8 n=1 Tax=Carlito syrichta TaxID=1868482 RepID=A0A1U7TF82_CARSF|nr:ly6/PLAUR domain-containing protein 8 [Carlito syrichta]